MRIKSIYIAAFGGIKNLRLDIDDGFNVIYGDNENGKTTVMSFIKMMFYGSDRSTLDLNKNIRKKYQPWDNSQMAGSIDFEHLGRNYRIEREFRSSNSTDKVILCDLDLGERQNVACDIGNELFGVTAQAFERTVFIGQFGFPESNTKAEGEINSKLSNIALTGDEAVSFDTVNERLLKAKTALMSKRGTAGIYDKNIAKINSLKERFDNAVKIHEEYSQAQLKLKEIHSNIVLCQGQAEELKQKLSFEEDMKNAAKLKNLLSLKSQLDAVNSELKLSDGNVADESYLKKLEFCIGKTEKAEALVDSKKEEISKLEKSIEAANGNTKEENEKQARNLNNLIDELKSKQAEKAEQQEKIKAKKVETEKALENFESLKKRFNPLLLLLGAVLVVAGIGALLLEYRLPSSALIILGLALIIIAFVIKPVDKKAIGALERKLAALKDELTIVMLEESRITGEISEKSARLEAINAALSGSVNIIENQKQMLKESISELEALKTDLDSAKQDLAKLYGRYKTNFEINDIRNEIDDIRQGATKQKEIKSQINYILKDIGNISYKEAKEKLDKITAQSGEISEDFDSLKTLYEEKTQSISSLKEMAAGLTAKIKAEYTSAENPEALKSEIVSLSNKAVAQKEFCDSLDIASKVLADSFIEVRRSFGTVLEKRSAEIFSHLTDSKYSAMTISKTLEIAVEEKERFGTKEAAYLSAGTADQAYLSLRLALAELMSQEDEHLPLFMDDALTQYDDTRMKNAVEFLKDYSENHQILLFTCHGAVACEAEKTGIKIKSIK